MSLCAPRDTQPRSASPMTFSAAVAATAVPGLMAGIPSMLTLPAPINSAACWRDRASPRRTNSASTRVRRGTVASGLLRRLQSLDQHVVRLGKLTRELFEIGLAGQILGVGWIRQLGEDVVDPCANLFRVGGNGATPPHRFASLAAARLEGPPLHR